MDSLFGGWLKPITFVDYESNLAPLHYKRKHGDNTLIQLLISNN